MGEDSTGVAIEGERNRKILEDLEQKVLSLRALHSGLRNMDAGESFAGVVARSRPRSHRGQFIDRTRR